MDLGLRLVSRDLAGMTTCDTMSHPESAPVPDPEEDGLWIGGLLHRSWRARERAGKKRDIPSSLGLSEFKEVPKLRMNQKEWGINRKWRDEATPRAWPRFRIGFTNNTFSIHLRPYSIYSRDCLWRSKQRSLGGRGARNLWEEPPL